MFHGLTTLLILEQPPFFFSAQADVIHCFVDAMIALLIQSTTQCLTVLISTLGSTETLSKHQWMSKGAVFSTWRNMILFYCFTRTSMSDATLSDCPSDAICHMATKYNRILSGRLNVYCHTSVICLWCHNST